ncbi:FKBP-type peptidyl-prolyl cis-trans isomerase [Mucilaginibacter sp. SP1R1]|uniref:FKBP-type peptidyl-prolyl cis-trans isomerase n=1 Tax=Mucilaginibacter sp. SP1R1 TaxID=2723091 RepID=UPI001622202A|nr:FKBP-type peptidyl-prolyl cis-trans isomerase [Mucilaginibacter sp. SP1R1]MBB6150195.1 FKBP-type peptidyl-prolyl cis-trans isomerase [Mucilaginibacter sp. SP1R1]
MKKYFLLLGLLIVVLSSCLKTQTPDVGESTSTVTPAQQASLDSAAIKTYLAANPSIKAKRDTTTGLYYQILNPGTGTTNPTLSSTVTVSYTGTLLNGTQFDASTGYTQSLSLLIPGWKIGLPLIKSGGSILLIIPSALAYGNNQVGSIPANSVLVFTINLISFI